MSLPTSTSHLEHIAAAVEATAFHSPAGYSWFGTRFRGLPKAIRAGLPAEALRENLVSGLTSLLYANFYCRGRAVPLGPEGALAPRFRRAESLGEALASANAGKGSFESEWEIQAVLNGEVLVRREGLELRVNRERLRISGRAPLAPGGRVSLRMPNGLPRLSPGFYMALGDAELGRTGAPGLVRLYWSLTPAGAVRFVRSATSQLNHAGLPFLLKVLDHRPGFHRCDSAVVYLRRTDYEPASAILRRTYREIAPSLRPSVPVFTKALVPGLALAEDPGAGESFGSNRCRLLADGLLRAHERRTRSVEQRLQVVRARFEEEGLSLGAPFLRAGSVDEYDVRPWQGLRLRGARGRVSTTAPAARDPGLRAATRESRSATWETRSRTGADSFLRAAEGIGRRLSRQAVWHGERCNWVGAAFQESGVAKGSTRLTYEALGPDLYTGTAGVAWFLAELHPATGDAAVRRTALGAARQALACVERSLGQGIRGPQLPRLGLYCGWMGVALAAARAGRVLGEAELLERAVGVARGAAPRGAEEREFDLLHGKAGAIAALLVLAEALEEGSFLDAARRLGGELVRSANRGESGISWGSSAPPSVHNLTGLSHGAAGAGYALLELFHATGHAPFRRTAEGAFAYERHWFDAGAGNWPDFRDAVTGRRSRRSTRNRGQDETRRRRRSPLSFATYWCNGAPGIALSRIRAYDLLGDETYRTEALAGLETTRRAVQRGLPSEEESFSLCHGLAGNAEVLLEGRDLLEREGASAEALAYAVAEAGLARHATGAQPWPCLRSGTETPGLMLGLAGIGYFYLRLHDARRPSVLLFRREDFTASPRGTGVETGPSLA